MNDIMIQIEEGYKKLEAHDDEAPLTSSEIWKRYRNDVAEAVVRLLDGQTPDRLHVRHVVETIAPIRSLWFDEDDLEMIVKIVECRIVCSIRFVDPPKLQS